MGGMLLGEGEPLKLRQVILFYLLRARERACPRCGAAEGGFARPEGGGGDIFGGNNSCVLDGMREISSLKIARKEMAGTFPYELFL